MRTASCGLPVSKVFESVAQAVGRLLSCGFHDRWHPQNALVL